MSEPLQVEDPLNPHFRAAVLAFLRKHRGDRVLEVVSVRSHGSDWEGDTEHGFYETFSTEVRWKDAAGTLHHEEFSGSEMGALWSFVMSWTP